MRRTVTGLGIVTMLAVAGSANAWSWNITGASGNTGFDGSSFSMDSPVNSYFSNTFTTAGNPQLGSNLNQANVSNILGNLGITLADDTLTYFSWVDDSDRGYFAAAYKNSKGSNFDFDLVGTNLAAGSQGLYSTNAFDFVSSGTSVANDILVQSGRTFLVVMGGYLDGSPQITMNFSDSSDSYNIEYLSRRNTSPNWQVVASGTATPSKGSGLNTAMYMIPLPAPVLLAGAGLVGAIAVRRRIAR